MPKGFKKNRSTPRVYGVGYLGGSEYNTTTHNQVYFVWAGMLKRCYSEKFQLKHKSQIGCKVCNDWHNFQNFAKWYSENCPLNYKGKLQLDKDILSPQLSGKLYSPENCCIIPRELNAGLVKTKDIQSFWKEKDKAYVVTVSKVYLGYFRDKFSAETAYKTAKLLNIKICANRFRSFLAQRVLERVENLCLQDI